MSQLSHVKEKKNRVVKLQKILEMSATVHEKSDNDSDSGSFFVLIVYIALNSHQVCMK